MAIMIAEKQLKGKAQEIKSGSFQIYSDCIGEYLRWSMPTSPWAALELLEVAKDLQQEEDVKLPAVFHSREYFHLCQEEISGHTQVRTPKSDKPHHSEQGLTWQWLSKTSTACRCCY